MAIIRFAAGAGTRLGGVVIDIVDHHEIEPAIAVVIDKTCRSGPVQVLQAGFLGNLAESAAALIEKESGTAELCDEHVGPAVVVDVADGHAHAVAGNI